MPRLHVATRKGLFTLKRSSAGAWDVDRVDFLGDPLSMFLADPRDGTLYAALNLGHFGCKLHRSSDSGATWEEVAVPVYPPAPPPEENATASMPAADPPEGVPPPAPPGCSLKEIWALEPGGVDEPDLLWMGTIPGGLFRSRDRGATWELIRSLWDLPERKAWFGGGKDLPGIHSICVDPRNSKHVTIGVSCGGVWTTHDGGETWACEAHGLRADFMPPERQYDPNIQDVHRVVQCPAQPDVFWTQHHNGIFHSVDDAKTWNAIEPAAPSHFGFAVVVHPHDPATAWFVPAIKDERRIPAKGELVVTRTRDSGKTMTVLRDGLPQHHAYDIVYRHCLDIDSTGNCLAFGSTTGGLWITEDGGDHWHEVPTRLPPIYCVRFDVTG